MQNNKINHKLFFFVACWLLLSAAFYAACGTSSLPAKETTQETTQRDASANEPQKKREAVPETSSETLAETTQLPETQVDNTPAKQSRGAGPQKAIDPGKRGPYIVGVTTIKLVDDSRKDKAGKGRPLTVEVWYPAEDAAQNTPTDIYNISNDAPDAVRKKIKSLGLPDPTMKQNAHRDAKPLIEDAPFPVILYSHGSGGIRFQSVFQTTHLASHGYVVISPDHTGNTLYDLFLNTNTQDPTRLMKSAQNRPLDMKFVMNAIEKKVKTKGDRFYQLATFEKVGMTGHSFGGLTSILSTRIFDNLAAIIPQAPATSVARLLGLRPEHIAPIPVMLMAAEKDQTLEYQKEQRGFFDKIIKDPYFDAERHLVSFTNGGHFTFSNICELNLTQYAAKLGIGNAAKILNDGCAKHNTPVLEAHRLINHYATGLFNVLLRKSKVSRNYLKQEPTKEITYLFQKP